MKETMYDELFLEIWVTLPIVASTLIVGAFGRLFNVTVETILWLIFGAVISIGVAALRGQVAGLGKIIDLLQETPN